MANDEKVKDALQWYDKNKKLYEKCAENEKDIIEKILMNREIPYHSITYRVKDRESYRHKCENEKYTNPIDEIMDLAGIRIIAYTNKDVQKICDIIKQEFEIDVQNSMDKHNVMNDNQVGYLSVHFITKLKENRTTLAEYKIYTGIQSEIQVRTLLQHTWAEIEHDRNYKFSGVLPKEIRRQFYLLAGVLELVDKEFDLLSEQIDSYERETEQKVTQGDYNIVITSESLKRYLLNKFDKSDYIKPCINGEIITNDVIEELLDFGFNTIKDIDNNITSDFLNMENTYIGLLRDIMICKDSQKYFEEVFHGQWGGTSTESVELWKTHGANSIERYLQEYGINVYNEEESVDF